MAVELVPTGRDPLGRLGSMSLITGLMGLVAILYSVVNIARGRDDAEAWMVGVGCCLLIGAVATSLIHGVLCSQQARIEALEKRADSNRPEPVQ